jgi:putative ABC transport system permease protein
MAPRARVLAAAQPCVEHVRPVLFAWAPLRRASGAVGAVQVVGVEPGARFAVPWSAYRGLPQDLHSPDRVSVDRFDLRSLELHEDPVGAPVEIQGRVAHVALVTNGIRAFTLQPYVFASLDTARRLLEVPEGRANFFVLDLRKPDCLDGLVKAMNRYDDLEALAADDFRRKTEAYWIQGSGIGGLLTFGALLGLLVGSLVIGQNLYSTTRDYRRELTTLKAMGASLRELAAFVAWQAALLAGGGSLLGSLMAFGLAHLAGTIGLKVILSPWVMASGNGVIVIMCGVSALSSLRSVLTLDPYEVFQ